MKERKRKHNSATSKDEERKVSTDTAPTLYEEEDAGRQDDANNDLDVEVSPEEIAALDAIANTKTRIELLGKLKYHMVSIVYVLSMTM